MRKPLKPDQARKVIESFGFELKNVQGSHWHYKKLGVGKVTIPFYHELSNDLFMWICRQAKVSKKEFWARFDELQKTKKTPKK